MIEAAHASPRQVCATSRNLSFRFHDGRRIEKWRKAKPNNGLFVIEGKEMELLGNRILETPVNGEATEILRDPHSGFTAYVPVGAVKKGEALVTKGGGKTIACAGCHGADLKGLGPVTGLAGRSPAT